jgi:hypothetical protein
MFKMQPQSYAAFEYTKGVVVTVIACFVLLVCLMIADKVFLNDRSANQTQLRVPRTVVDRDIASHYDRRRWNTNG